MELEIKSKKIDYHYSEFRMLLIAYICVYFMSPIFIFFIKSDKKYYYILLINAVFVVPVVPNFSYTTLPLLSIL